MQKRSELRLFVSAFAATTLALVCLIEFRVIEHISYAMEKGRLRALRESLPEAGSDTDRVLTGRAVPEFVRPAVVSIEAEFAAQAVAMDDPDFLDSFRDELFGQGFPDLRLPITGDADLAEADPPGDEPGVPDDVLIPQGLGSGFVFDADHGYVLTNAHVVVGAERLRVYLEDGRSTDAHVLGTDTESDLAVIQIPLDSLHALPFGDSKQAQVGDEVLAVGNPFGLDGSVTKGILSAVGRRNVDIGGLAYPSLLQTDAVISPGSSGGPLVNMRGEVIGINTAMATNTGRYDGVGFAIPANRAQRIVADLIEGGPGSLGVMVGAVNNAYWRQEATSLGWTRTYGALVTDILPGGAAERAKVMPMDIIFAVNDQPIEDNEFLAQTISRTKPGTQVEMEVWRNHQQVTVPIEVGRRYAPR